MHCSTLLYILKFDKPCLVCTCLLVRYQKSNKKSGKSQSNDGMIQNVSLAMAAPDLSCKFISELKFKARQGALCFLLSLCTGVTG